jgi:hypothetical protein
MDFSHALSLLSEWLLNRFLLPLEPRALLAKYANFFERRQIINQLQHSKKRVAELTPK